MPRIFKGSESTLRLLISKTGDYQALTEIKIKLYTTDIENAIEVIDGIEVDDNIATITLAPRAFMGMEDGLINYIIDGATEDDVFHTERQSNYMLKTLSYINEDGVATQTMTIDSNGEYRITPNDGLYVDISVNVEDVNGSYDDGFNVGYEQGYAEGEQEGYNTGYEQGQADVAANARVLEVTENGQYGDGETLYKTIDVNVVPKISVREYGIKFSNSTFSEVPEWAYFEGVTDMDYMFRNCSNIQTIPLIDTSNVTTMYYMFGGCGKLQTIPNIDTSTVVSMDSMFNECGSLQSLTSLNTGNVTNMNSMFYSYGGIKSLISLPKFDCGKLRDIGRYFCLADNGMSGLVDVGGWENLKIDWNDGRGLDRCPNLSRESCINILNGLYDFRGNGDTTTTKTLKVHQNFLDTVGEDILIGINKGWTITA